MHIWHKATFIDNDEYEKYGIINHNRSLVNISRGYYL